MGRSTSNLITQAEYARLRKARSLPGGTRKAVHAAVAAGSIDAFGPDKLIDPELADRQWAKNRRARIAVPAAREISSSGHHGISSTAAPSAPAAATSIPPSGFDNGYSSARTRREQAEADLAEMNARKMRGELVEWAGVVRGGFEVGRDLRDALEAAVNALSAELASLTNAEDCAALLRRHNRALCEALVRSWREKVGPLPSEGIGT